MELMSTCLDKLLKRTRRPIPEMILGKMAVAVSTVYHIQDGRKLSGERGVIRVEERYFGRC